MVNLLVYLDKYGVVVQFLLVILDNQQGAFLFPFAGRLVPGKCQEGTALSEQFEPPGFCRKHQCLAFRLLVGFRILNLGVNVLHAVGKLVIVLFHLGGDQQFLPQSFALFLCELGKGMEVGFVVFHDGLVNEHVLNLGRKLIALVYQEYQRFEEVFLLPEILVILFLCHLERVHGDGLLFGVRDVCALVVAADTLVGISRIDHDHIGLLLQQLADDTVHVEALAASARPDAEEVGVVGHLDLAFLAGDVDADR